ncbi:8-amino-7-oxononanoate synthase [Bacillus sp. WMMC1349]|uniref:8-amino-7-oxononanoate synthase n=1 Tax=Bacillus sp. WMMC1349 TaxID=2736254 RepID=UPI0015539A63|nr:8-amino-7-oxononanoate synthase [Bacillus sp. WMMC1349]NPC91803.1 8-amino-7-oxononanoate synthase [Bacillus sp. WMMC1349]
MSVDEWLSKRLERTKTAGLYRTLPATEHNNQVWASNDYMNLTHHKQVILAAETALHDGGTGSSGSRLTTGNTEWHEKLEQKLANFKETEAALLFSSGYLANMGVLQSLPEKGDIIFSDQYNHASIIDGCRLSKAETVIYQHIDVDDLEEKLTTIKGFKRRFIVTDGVFSMDGTIAPLDKIMPLAKRFQAIVIVDDAHATGVLGKNGRGTSEYFGVCPDIVIGTLSKAIGAEGGFVAGSKTLIDFLRNYARTFIFQTAIPPASCAAAFTALELIKNSQEKRQHLHSIITTMKSGLKRLGYAVKGDLTPIIPVIIGDPQKTVLFAKRLQETGIYAPAIRPPTVPKGESRIRLTVTADHSLTEITALLAAFDFIGKELNLNK